MKVVDANVLLYAVNSDAPNHHVARDWLDRSLSGAETIAFTWLVLMAFVRISTHPSILPRPLASSESFDVCELWLSQPGAVVLEPSARHLAAVRTFISSTGTAGNLVNDAHLAAIALDHSAEVVTFDADFTRFKGLRVHRLN